ncbi:hypothetical protein OK142_20880 [Agrobacterium sp. BT-220-3]|nr:hypothetical protein [Agrobacterium sp. BT-220-3]
MAIDILTTLKIVAKKLARKRRIQHFAALEIVAREVGKPHWRGLAEAYKQGWQPTPAQMESLPDLLSEPVGASSTQIAGQTTDVLAFGDKLAFSRWVPDDVKPMEADEIYGELDGRKFYLVGDEFSIAFGSQGWEIGLDQAPSAKPELRRLGGRVKSVEALDLAFIERATQLLKIRARRMHADVSANWPRRSTMPDQQGRALHPLGGGLSAEWHCLHCDGVHDGHTMAKNLWHCIDCGATPIDIFPTPFWNGVEQSA